jgi:hypothetical protein
MFPAILKIGLSIVSSGFVLDGLGFDDLRKRTD